MIIPEYPFNVKTPNPFDPCRGWHHRLSLLSSRFQPFLQLFQVKTYRNFSYPCSSSSHTLLTQTTNRNRSLALSTTTKEQPESRVVPHPTGDLPQLQNHLFQSTNRLIQSLRIPLAVEETLTQASKSGKAERSNVFFEEPQVPEEYRAKEEHFKKTQAYKKLNLSRGHMAAAGNYNFDQRFKDNSVGFWGYSLRTPTSCLRTPTTTKTPG